MKRKITTLAAALLTLSFSGCGVKRERKPDAFNLESRDDPSTYYSVDVLKHRETGIRYIVVNRTGGGAAIIPLVEKAK